MTSDEILTALSEVIGDALDIDNLRLKRETTAKDVDGWDSLAQVRIVVAAESRFKIRFSTTEMASLPNVGALVDLIANKLEKTKG
jgi:acyl carrier protein